MPSMVQQANVSSTANSVTLSFGNNITAGNGVIVCTTMNMSTGVSVVGGGSETFTTGDAAFIGSIWYVISSAGGYKSIVLTAGGGATGVIAYAYETPPLAQSDISSGVQNTGGTWTSGTGTTTSFASEVWIGQGAVEFSASSSGNTITGPTSSWTNQSVIKNIHFSAGWVSAVSGYQFVTSVGSPTYSGTCSTVNENFNGGNLHTFQLQSGVSVPVATVNVKAPTVSAGPGFAVQVANIAVSVPQPSILISNPLIVSVGAGAGVDDMGTTFPAGIYTTIPLQIQGAGGENAHATLTGTARQLTVQAPLQVSTDTVGQFTLASSSAAGGAGFNVPSSAGAHIGIDMAGNLYIAFSNSVSALLHSDSSGNLVLSTFEGTGGMIANGKVTIAAGGLAVTGGSATDTLTVTSTSLLQGIVTAQNALIFDNISTPSTTGSAVTSYSASGQLATVNAAGLQMNMSGSQLAAAGSTVVAAVLTNWSAAFTIPANDAEAGAVYELHTFGHGTQGSSVQTLQIGFSLAGSSVFNFTWPNTLAGISGQFVCAVTLRLYIATTGSGGTYWGTMQGTAGAGGTSTPVTNIGGHESVGSINTTVSNTVQLQAKWGGTTGAPTVTNTAAWFKRIA